MRNSMLKIGVLAASLSAAAFATVPDGVLTSRTKLSLWTTAGLRSSGVHVDSDDGVVTLHGKVPTAEQRANAEKATRAVAGVREVKNLIQVVALPDEKRLNRSDKETRAQAEKALKAEGTLKDSKIVVKSVDKGVVLLTGDAKTLSDHLRAVAIVDRVPGVRRVASEIKSPDGFGVDERVTFTSQNYPAPVDRSNASDMRISIAAKLRLLTTAQVPSTEISVDTDDGVVTLFGIVPTEDVKRAAGVEVGKVSGVRSVENQLEVVASSQKKAVEAKDADITTDLALAFKNRTELKGVSSAVKNGTVRLSGSVSSGWDEVNAVRISRQVSGVRGVEDSIKVEETPQ